MGIITVAKVANFLTLSFFLSNFDRTCRICNLS